MNPWSARIPNCRVPWEADADWDRVAFSIGEALKLIRPSQEYFTEFFRQSMTMFVYHSNRMEQTIHPNLAEGETCLMIQRFLDGEAFPERRPWDAEGGRELHQPSAERQLYQFARAAEYLCVDRLHDDLSVELICECHLRMMSGSTGDGGAPTTMGIRTRRANAGFHVFVEPSHIESGLALMIRSYRHAKRSGAHPIELATQLFYDCITIHPFENGNGRLCRLLLAWSLLREGFPFFVSFSTGHRSRRQHYMHAIHTAREPVVGHRKELNCILMQACQRCLGNYLANANATGLITSNDR